MFTLNSTSGAVEPGEGAAATPGAPASEPAVLTDSSRRPAPLGSSSMASSTASDDGAVVMSACDATGGGTELGRRYPRTVLGQTMPVPVGPVWMAYMSGAPLLTVHCYRSRDSDALFTAEIGPEVALRRDGGAGTRRRELVLFSH